LLPDDLIVGKAWLVWKSVDPYSGRFRWERILKKIEEISRKNSDRIHFKNLLMKSFILF